jgi:type IV secretory pathway VirB2 component (pilin)
MEKVIEVLGKIAGVLGILTCIVSGTFRLFGEYNVLNQISVEALFMLGVGLMVAACLAKLQLLSSRG